MTLEILILTMPHRHEFLGQLLSLLEPQIVGKFDEVDIRISGNDLDLPVGRAPRETTATLYSRLHRFRG